MKVSFVQMADPQFGMYSSISKLSESDIAERRERGINIEYTGPVLEGFTKETLLFTEAIETANEILPDFVVVCGDMVHEADSEDQFQDIVNSLAAITTMGAGLIQSVLLKYENLCPLLISTNIFSGEDPFETCLQSRRYRQGGLQNNYEKMCRESLREI